MVEDVPTIPQVLTAVRPIFSINRILRAGEFLQSNPSTACGRFSTDFKGLDMQYPAHIEFPQLVARAVGLIPTGDTVQYANLILDSG